MSTAAPREGRDHDTSLPGAAAVAALVLLALAAQFSPQLAAAQSAPCTAIQDDAERLACYDRALRAASPAPPAPAVQAPAAPAPAPEVRSPEAQSPAPQSAAAPAPQSAAAPASPDKQILPMIIVDVRTLPGRETLFTAQDGTVWVQTDSQRVVGLPATPFDAELKPGALSSQFLVPKNGARAIRVRQAER
jgi:hypothetical protein